MSDEPMDADPRLTPSANGPRADDDPMRDALGYEAADPALQAGPWGDPAAALHWEP